MPFKPAMKPDYGSIWLNGGPNTGKTTSLKTAPRPCAIVSVPGENGHASIPYGEDILPFVWEDDGTPMKDRSTLYYMKIWREVETLVQDLIMGKHGEIKTLVIDGIHKMNQVAIAIASDAESERLHSAFVRNEKGKLAGEFSPLCYGKSNNLFLQFVKMIAQSKVPYRIFTSWTKESREDFMDPNSPCFIKPALTSALQDAVLGEVSLVLYSMIDPKGNYVWQTKAAAKVAGANMKGDAALLEKIPIHVPQDFQALEKYFVGETPANR